MAEQGLDRLVHRLGAALGQAARGYQPQVLVRHEGRVQSVGDGALHIEGLPGARTEELVEVGSGGTALVLGVGPEGAEAVALHGGEHIAVGDAVRSTGQQASIHVGDGLLGRAVDALGRPVDGVPLAGGTAAVPLQRRAPAIHERAAIHRPLYTGVLAIDAMFPIGCGQRELVVGEEGTGKTSLVLDVMLRQSGTDVVCVYVGIGRRRSETWRVIEALRKGGGRWVAVFAPDDDSPGLRYLAPYAGAAIAEHFSRRGEHALIVYDDLTAHAVAWRELSLLLRRPPGREAYPGDVFYLHSRLLERAAQLSPEMGGGSLTALPVALLEGGRLTSYIPTNLISITDGQIVLSRSMFAAGQRPAIDGALSVSRVGSKAQPQAFKALAGRMRLDYAAFLELEAFSRLGTRLESKTQRRIDLGRRIRGLLAAGRGEPLGVLDEVLLLLLASREEALLSIPEASVGAVARELRGLARRELGPVADRIERDALLSTGDEEALSGWLDARVAQRFAASLAVEIPVEVSEEEEGAPAAEEGAAGEGAGDAG